MSVSSAASMPYALLRASVLLVLGALSFGKTALAGAITVGLGADCTEGTIQAAVDRAYRLCNEGFCGYNLILVTDDVPQSVHKENISVPDMGGHPDLSIELVGGFNNCRDLIPTGGKASIYRVTIDPILDVRGRTDLRVRNFWIEGGQDGIYWQGHGRIELTDVTLNNHVRSGFTLQGEGGEARMELLGGVEVTNNANFGIYAWQNSAVVIRGERNRVSGTRGGSYPGNGIDLSGQAHLEIGATGEVISDNQGYGIHVDHSGNTDVPTSRLYSTDPANPLAIARNRNGAIYHRAVDSAHRLCLKNVAIHRNTNRAFYVTGDRAVLDVNDEGCGFPAAAAITCATPQASGQCNALADNTTTTGKPLVAAVHGAKVGLHRLLIFGNKNTSSLLSTNLGEGTSTASITLTDSVVMANIARDNLFEALNGGVVDIWDSTVFQNGGQFQVGFVGIAPGLMQMTNSILDQAQSLATLENTDGSTTHFTRVLARNRDGAPVGDDILLGQPSYLDGIGRLQPASLGVDYAPAGGGVDFDGNPRDVDTAGLPDQYGPRDLGAFESQLAVLDRIFASGFERRQAFRQPEDST